MATRRDSKKRMRICFDRIIPYDEGKIRAAELAIKANPANAPKIPAKLAGVSMHPAKIALFTGKKWANGSELSIAFLDGSKTQRQRVAAHAAQWMKYANVRLSFNGGKNSAVRVSFAADDGSWSYVGTDCLTIAKDEPTMNYGWLEDDTEETEYNRVVVHEFGHALGAIHEHQNPKAGIKWNLPMVYKVFSGPPNNWSKEEIDFNIVKKYSLDQLNATKFDRLSIMLYSFPAELIVGGVATPENTKLSSGDKRFIKKMYPKPKS
jgi:Astacin (Peptidase family M12A)